MSKQVFTIYGNCQSTILAACLQQVKSFKERFEYRRLPFCHRIKSTEYEKLCDDISNIDLLITQPVSTEFRGGGYDSKTLTDLSDNYLGFPSLQFFGYFPSLSRFNVGKLSKADTERFNNYLIPYAPLNKDSLYHYNELRMMVLENYPTSTICHRFDSGSNQEFSLEKCLNWTLGHLRSKEDEFGLINISDYLLENWQNKLLFYTPRHPSGYVMAELVCRICNRLGLEVCSNEVDRIIAKDHFSHIKLYIPEWIRTNYLKKINYINDESFFTLTAVDTVSLYTNLYRLLPSALNG